MSQSLALATVVVDDYDSAIAYYTGALGFDLLQDDDRGNGKRWVRVAPAGSRGTGLLLARAVDPAQRARIGDQTGGRVGFFLETDDFERDHARMLAQGVVFEEAPRDEPYATVAVFRDLLGNRWDLLQPRGPQPTPAPQAGPPGRLVLASSNAGKLEELVDLLAGLPCTLVAQSELGVTDADETGLTFVENALIKARHACQATGLPALADDSGLCVDALQGAPGLRSARYAGGHGDSSRNIDKLLEAMADLEDGQRGAHFHCALVLMQHAGDPQPLLVEGSWRGVIARERRGDGGHGYDPVFMDPASGQSAAQMPLALKNRISHRGQALALLRQRLLAAVSTPGPAAG